MTTAISRDEFLIEGMLRHAEVVAAVVKKGRADLDADPIGRYALEHALELFSEAAEKVSAGRRGRVPSVPWAELRHLRTEVAHPYDVEARGSPRDRLWRVARDDLPRYVAALRRRSGRSSSRTP